FKIAGKIDSNLPLKVDIQDLKTVELTKDTSTKISDGGFELYALFKYDANLSAYEYIPLQIFESYYFRNFQYGSYQSIIHTIDSYILNIRFEGKTSIFFKNGNEDDES